MTASLEVRRVSHSHGSGSAAVRVLDDVSLSAVPGELVALAGRSGSGKSTLCHLVAGVSRPQHGSVLVHGRPAHEVDDWVARAFLPQRLGIAEELTVAENAFLPCRLHGLPADLGLLDRLGLLAIADRPGVQTSLGEQQRTALVRALCTAPGLLVLDEPTGHQDDDNVELVLAALRAVTAGGTTTLVATHDERVLDAADRVVRLEGGRVVGVEGSYAVGQARIVDIRPTP